VFGLAPDATARFATDGRPRDPRRTGRVLGRVQPGTAEAQDIATGLSAVESLAPFATGAGAVVIRRYVRAIEAAEGPLAMLERTSALRRQWGLRWRKAGVFVRRADAADDVSLVSGLLAQAARLELGGMAVAGTAEALAAYEEAGRIADGLGLFLVVCEAL
ncbi:MAG TPA: UDP-2,3-diacylglucosamine diphosphatase LpxI, partial [Hyphomicrobiaceae bacterium]|nr:UDP-2,3-diacylglucosamine diphosphatase LpxI [Hyphomicrobiaceae bacterium]